MRKHTKDIGIWLLLIAFSPSAFAKKVETIHFDLNGDGVKDTVTLSKPDEYSESEEFIEYTDIEISMGKVKTIHFDKLDGISFNKGCFKGETKNQLKRENLLKSDRLVLIEEKNGGRLLMQFGNCYGATQELGIYRIDIKGIQEIWRKNFYLKGIAESKGTKEIIGKPCLEEIWGESNNMSSYVPFQIWELGEHPALNIKNTKSYNIENYVGYVGPDCTEDYMVIENNGKKEIVPSIK